MTLSSLSDQLAVAVDERVLRAAVAAYLGRYRGESRVHTGSDLKVFLTWCAGQELDPFNLGRAEIERYVRWLQEVRRYQPSTVSRRLSVVIGFYRVCVIDQILAHSPADYARRPLVPPESPTLGLSHLQFEAMITAARLSANINDFALVTMLGLLGLRIFEAYGANIADLGEEHGHRVLKVRSKGDKVVLVPLPPAVARAIDRAVDERDDGPIAELRTLLWVAWPGFRFPSLTAYRCRVAWCGHPAAAVMPSAGSGGYAVGRAWCRIAASSTGRLSIGQCQVGSSL